MTEDEAARGLPNLPPTYTLRDGTPVCTSCGAVVGEPSWVQERLLI
jgi:hypothetical protein